MVRTAHTKGAEGRLGGNMHNCIDGDGGDNVAFYSSGEVVLRSPSGLGEGGRCTDRAPGRRVAGSAS